MAVQPYPDELLEQLPDRREGPEDVAPAKGTVELAFGSEAHFDLPAMLTTADGTR